MSVRPLSSSSPSTEPRLPSVDSLPPQLLAQLFVYLPTAVAIWRFTDLDDPLSLCFVAANPVSLAQMGVDMSGRAGQRMNDIFDQQVPAQLLETYAQVARSGRPLNMGEVTFGAGDEKVVFEMQVFPLEAQHIAIIHVDATERKKVEEAAQQAKLQAEIIRAQEATLAELSTPMLAVGSGVMVMPLVGSVDSRRAAQVMERMLEGVSEARARAVILDITGIPVVDTQVANALIRSAQAVQLLGARVIITGIRPEVAQTLVGLNVDLGGISTQGTLEDGIAEAIGQASRLAGLRGLVAA